MPLSSRRDLVRSVGLPLRNAPWSSTRRHPCSGARGASSHRPALRWAFGGRSPCQRFCQLSPRRLPRRPPFQRACRSGFQETSLLHLCRRSRRPSATASGAWDAPLGAPVASRWACPATDGGAFPWAAARCCVLVARKVAGCFAPLLGATSGVCASDLASPPFACGTTTAILPAYSQDHDGVDPTFASPSSRQLAPSLLPRLVLFSRSQASPSRVLPLLSPHPCFLLGAPAMNFNVTARGRRRDRDGESRPHKSRGADGRAKGRQAEDAEAFFFAGFAVREEREKEVEIHARIQKGRRNGEGTSAETAGNRPTGAKSLTSIAASVQSGARGCGSALSRHRQRCGARHAAGRTTSNRSSETESGTERRRKRCTATAGATWINFAPSAQSHKRQSARVQGRPRT